MAVRLLFAEELGQRATFIFFVPGVVVAGALSGLRPGTLAALGRAAPGPSGDSRHGPGGGGSLIACRSFIVISLALLLGGAGVPIARARTPGGDPARAGGRGP